MKPPHRKLLRKCVAAEKAVRVGGGSGARERSRDKRGVCIAVRGPRAARRAGMAAGVRKTTPVEDRRCGCVRPGINVWQAVGRSPTGHRAGPTSRELQAVLQGRLCVDGAADGAAARGSEGETLEGGEAALLGLGFRSGSGFGLGVRVRVRVRDRVGVIPRGRRASTRGAREARPHITRPGRRGTL
eukprot:scaffold38728_cov56-Phaeocystis_antarctica.AAC.3